MRTNTVLLCCSLALALCALSFGVQSRVRGGSSMPPPPTPVQQGILSADVAPEDSASSTSATAVALVTPRELVRPTVTLSDPKISIQSAVTRVCEQAGMKYDFNRSKEGAGAACRRYIQVSLANATLDEALAQIVLKNGLRYRMEGQSLWLEAPE